MREMLRTAIRWLTTWLRRLIATAMVRRMRRTDKRRAFAHSMLALALLVGLLFISKSDIRYRRLEWLILGVGVWTVAAWKIRQASYGLLSKAAG